MNPAMMYLLYAWFNATSPVPLEPQTPMTAMECNNSAGLKMAVFPHIVYECREAPQKVK